MAVVPNSVLWYVSNLCSATVDFSGRLSHMPHMLLTHGLNASAHLPNMYSSRFTWDAIYPNNAVFGDQPADFAGDSFYQLLLLLLLLLLKVDVVLLNPHCWWSPLCWTLYLRYERSLNVPLTTYFLYNRSLYDQRDCVTMGSPLYPIIVNFYMESFEQQAISSAAKKSTH